MAVAGQKFHGEPCGKCSGTERYASSGACVCCAKAAVAVRNKARAEVREQRRRETAQAALKRVGLR